MFSPSQDEYARVFSDLCESQGLQIGVFKRPKGALLVQTIAQDGFHVSIVNGVCYDVNLSTCTKRRKLIGCPATLGTNL